MEGTSMATIKKVGNTAVISGDNASEVFKNIVNTPPIDFKEAAKRAKKYHMSYSEKGLVRILKRKMYHD